MARTPRALTQLLLALIIPALAVLFFSGPASAAGRGSSTHSAAAATHRPCGIRHYPPCPVKPPKNHVNKHHVKAGHAVHVQSWQYPGNKTLKVYLRGHGHNKLVVKVTTDKHGNAHYSVKVPSNFKSGTYQLIFKASGYHKRIDPITIRVQGKHKHHHHHHHHHH